MKDLEKKAIAHYIKETHKKLEKLREDISTDLTCNYMHDKACDGPSYARSYIEDIKYRLNAIQCDLDKVANREIWESDNG